MSISVSVPSCCRRRSSAPNVTASPLRSNVCTRYRPPCRQRTRHRTAPSFRTSLWLSMLLLSCLTTYSMPPCWAPPAIPPFLRHSPRPPPYAPPHANDTKLGPYYPNPLHCIFLRGGRGVWPQRRPHP